jgi:DNA replication protein DnaC
MARALHDTLDNGKKIQFTPDEFIAHLVDSETDMRNNNRIARLLKIAKLRHKATLADIDFNSSRGLNRNQLLRFSSSSWFEKNENIILTGSTGVGKSFIACAIGYEACIHSFTTLYFHFGKLMNHLKLSKADGSLQREIRRLQSANILILDDFGLEPLDKQARLFFLEILEDRYENGTTLITSQLPLKNWHEFIADNTIADAICDRVIHNSHRIELKGDSLRKKFSKISD